MRKSISNMSTNYTQTESSLIAACLKGDRKSQKALYTLYSPKFFSVCLKYTKNQMDAEDVLQEGFIKLFKTSTSSKEKVHLKDG